MRRIGRSPSILLAVVFAGAVSGCGLEDAPLASVDISDLRKTTDNALAQSAEGHEHGDFGQTAPGGQQSASTVPTPEPTPTAQTAAPATGSSSTDITVQITENGYNGQPKGFTLSVKKGSKVRIKFVNADPTGDNVHIIAFSGLPIPEFELSNAHPSETVEFAADAAGRYGFSCQNQWCTIHPKLRGALVVEE